MILPNKLVHIGLSAPDRESEVVLGCVLRLTQLVLTGAHRGTAPTNGLGAFAQVNARVGIS